LEEVEVEEEVMVVFTREKRGRSTQHATQEEEEVVVVR